MIHYDQITLSGYVPQAWVNNAIYMISEFTADNGATLVVDAGLGGNYFDQAVIGLAIWLAWVPFRLRATAVLAAGVPGRRL